MNKIQAQEQQEALTALRGLLPPGTAVYTILRHVSRSGMQREISVIGPETQRLDWLVKRALGLRIGRHDGLVMGGCGMDMGFALVYDLARALYPQGHACTGEDCPSNDHTNGDRDRTPHQHTDGGYALTQRWL